MRLAADAAHLQVFLGIARLVAEDDFAFGKAQRLVEASVVDICDRQAADDRAQCLHPVVVSSAYHQLYSQETPGVDVAAGAAVVADMTADIDVDLVHLPFGFASKVET